jgi:hypothetical protein
LAGSIEAVPLRDDLAINLGRTSASIIRPIAAASVGVKSLRSPPGHANSLRDKRLIFEQRLAKPSRIIFEPQERRRHAFRDIEANAGWLQARQLTELLLYIRAFHRFIPSLHRVSAGPT